MIKKQLIGLLLVFVACTTSKVGNKVVGGQHFRSYKVYKIDSVNSYYLLYAKSEDSVYKIVSKKDTLRNENRIQIKKSYPFNLHSILSKRQIGNNTVLRKNSLLVNCFYYDDSTKICLEGKAIRDLYNADNVKGIYFLK